MNSPIPSKDLQGGNVSRDAMQLIKADRKKLESLFKQYEKTSAGDLEARERLVSEMTQQVSKIVSLKAQTVYPPMQAKLSRRGREMVCRPSSSSRSPSACSASCPRCAHRTRASTPKSTC